MYPYTPQPGGRRGVVIGYATLSGMLSTSTMFINKVINTPCYGDP